MYVWPHASVLESGMLPLSSTEQLTFNRLWPGGLDHNIHLRPSTSLCDGRHFEQVASTRNQLGYLGAAATRRNISTIDKPNEGTTATAPVNLS